MSRSWLRNIITKIVRVDTVEQYNRRALHLKAGSGVTLTASDSESLDESVVTISASGGEGGGSPSILRESGASGKISADPLVSAGAFEVAAIQGGVNKRASEAHLARASRVFFSDTIRLYGGWATQFTKIVNGSTESIPDGWTSGAYSTSAGGSGSAGSVRMRFSGGQVVEVSAGEATKPLTLITLEDFGDPIRIPFATSPVWRVDAIASPTWAQVSLGSDYALANGWYRVSAMTGLLPSGATQFYDVSAYPDYAYVRIAANKIVEVQGGVKTPRPQRIQIDQIDGSAAPSGSPAVWEVTTIHPVMSAEYSVGDEIVSRVSGGRFFRMADGWTNFGT